MPDFELSSSEFQVNASVTNFVKVWSLNIYKIYKMARGVVANKKMFWSLRVQITEDLVSQGIGKNVDTCRLHFKGGHFFLANNWTEPQNLLMLVNVFT